MSGNTLQKRTVEHGRYTVSCYDVPCDDGNSKQYLVCAEHKDDPTRLALAVIVGGWEFHDICSACASIARTMQNLPPPPEPTDLADLADLVAHHVIAAQVTDDDRGLVLRIKFLAQQPAAVLGAENVSTHEDRAVWTIRSPDKDSLIELLRCFDELEDAPASPLLNLPYFQPSTVRDSRGWLVPQSAFWDSTANVAGAHADLRRSAFGSLDPKSSAHLMTALELGLPPHLSFLSEKSGDRPRPETMH